MQIDIRNNLLGKITILAKTEILKVSLHNSTNREPIGLSIELI